ncbi:hypothetical protein IQ37_02705 [Chryseobacterium piperi]|uniref:Uncharacterized protein n=1 Tax=Chryseobacterium piperi TaxID=558152 RepID=A0A086BMC5_9FLAO|nr:hypothetical protein [Chryseobacterium piperi]ASW75452.1 hypothetical protein CJF12_14970 [Chryseobacterium piperi]KFF30089.1 hypothetical protein IQ37_02705 [Chryseobacterium piperi]
METLIIIGGIYSLTLGVFHLFFWKFFNWGKDLTKLSLVNKGIMQILNIQMIFVFFSTGLICLFLRHQILETTLGKLFLLANSAFWGIRVINQFIFLRINDYRIHLLTLVFIIGCILFLIPAIN